MSQNKSSQKYKNYIKQKFNKNNMLAISFSIFISIAIIIGVSLGTKRLWFDIVSIIAIFYITLPMLTMIFAMGGKGVIRKTLDLFKFKEIKNMNKKNFTESEQKQLKALDMSEEQQENKPKDHVPFERIWRNTDNWLCFNL